MESHSQERRQELTQKVRALSTRDFQLWSVGFLVMLVLASGILCFLLPYAHADFKVELRYVPQLSMGLIAMVLLLNFYLIDKRRELDEFRQKLYREMAFDEGFDRFVVIDPLTQVYRRSHLHTLLEEELRRARREQIPVTFLLIKYVGIKRLAAAYGDATSDSFIADVAKLLQQNFRGSDRIVRFSDSEFLVVMTGTNRKQADIACNRLQGYVDRWNLLGEKQWEMCLTLALGEYQEGTGPFELIGSLVTQASEVLSVAETSRTDVFSAAAAAAATLK